MNAHLTKFKVKTIGKVWRSQLGYLLSGYEDSATILGFTFLTRKTIDFRIPYFPEDLGFEG